MSVSLTEKQPGARLVGIAIIDMHVASKKIITLGGDLMSISLGGRPIWVRSEFRGFHIGFESIEVELPAGENRIAIETGPAFFVSVTDRVLDQE